MGKMLLFLALVVAMAGMTGCGSSCCNSQASSEKMAPSTTTYTHSAPAPVEAQNEKSYAVSAAPRSGPISVDDSSFASEIAGFKGIAIVDFSATWCGPCKKLAPVVDQVANEMAGRIKVGKLDIDRAPQIANQFSVNAVPTIIMFRDGVEVGRTRGYQSKAELTNWLESNLSANATADDPKRAEFVQQ